MSLTDDEKDKRVREQAETIRLLTDLTNAGSWADPGCRRRRNAGDYPDVLQLG